MSSRHPLHLVLKIEKRNLRQRSLRSPACFRMVNRILQRYASMFFVKIDQVSVQHDHIHLRIRTSRRCLFQHFFRVVAGQIAQQFQRCGWVTGTPAKLWKCRPFTRIVLGSRAVQTLRNYIQLNEKEVTGVIPYRKERLRGLSAGEWEILWA